MQFKELISQLRESGFGRIADRIELEWTQYTTKEYFNSLLISTREDREGFPPEVFDCILKLYLLHENIYHKDVDEGAWNNVD